MEIRDHSFSDAWPRILRRVLDLGELKYIGHHAQWVFELDEPIITVVLHPQYNFIPDGSGWTLQTLDMYADQFLKSVNSGFTYTYGERIHEHNQIRNAGARLRYNPGLRQCIAVTWKPEKDQEEKYPPCMIVLDFKIYQGKLNTTGYFRSNDVFMALPQNFYGIMKVAESVSNMALGHRDLGKIIIISNAPHIYFSLVLDAFEVAGFDPKDIESRYQEMVDKIYKPINYYDGVDGWGAIP